MTFEQLCKAKNKNFPGGLWGRENSRASKETVLIYSGPGAPVWLKPKTLTKLRGISKNLVSYSLWEYLLLGCFSPLSDISLLLLFLAGGNWAKEEFEARLWRRWNGKSQGVWGPVTEPYPWPMNSWSSSQYLQWLLHVGNSILDLPFVVPCILTGNLEVVALQRPWYAWWCTQFTWLLELLV